MAQKAKPLPSPSNAGSYAERSTAGGGGGGGNGGGAAEQGQP